MAWLPAILTLCTVVAGALALVEVSMPEHVEAELSQSVTIPCTHSISGPHGNVMLEWFVETDNGERERIAFQEESSTWVDKGTDYTQRVNLDTHRCLTINPVLLRDEREFLCQVTAGAVGSNEGRTRLKVYDAPEAPKVNINSAILSVTAEQPSEIGGCTSRNGYPAPNITWFKDDVPLRTITTHDPNMYMIPRVVKEASGLYTVSSRLYLKLNKQDKDSRFRCQIRYPWVGGEEALDSPSFSVSLHYHTENVTFDLDSEGKVKEGDEVRLRCVADGFPQPDYIFSRIVGGEEQEIKNSKYGMLILEDVTRNDSGTYRCEVLDFDAPEDVQLKKDLSIFVHYLQTPELTVESPLTIQLGQTQEVSCSSHGSVAPKITWKKGLDHLSHSETLVLKEVGYKSSGTYMCEASVPSVSGLVRTRELNIQVEGMPWMETNQSEVRVGREGERVTLTCAASGYPLPTLKWSLGKQAMVSSSDQAVVSKVSLPVTSTLINTGVTCNGSNAHGWTLHRFWLLVVPPVTDTPVTAEGTEEETGSVALVVIAAVGGVLVLLLLISILICLCRRGKCGHGKSDEKDLVCTEVRNDDIVVEMRTGQAPETSGLLRTNAEKRPALDQR